MATDPPLLAFDSICLSPSLSIAVACACTPLSLRSSHSCARRVAACSSLARTLLFHVLHVLFDLDGAGTYGLIVILMSLVLFGKGRVLGCREEG